MTGLAPTVEQDVQQAVYFPDDLRIDRSSRFLSSGVQVLLADSSGRCGQIFSLTAINPALSFWRRWYASISDWALRHAEGEETIRRRFFRSLSA
jgi:hypothetical protein